MEHIDYVTDRVGRSEVKDKHTITQITVKSKGKGNAWVGCVELMGNVSPLWCCQAGWMYLQCVYKIEVEHLRETGSEVAELSDCSP